MGVSHLLPQSNDNGRAVFSRILALTFLDGVMAEDGGIFEQTQSMLGSGAKKEFHLCDEELLIRHHHK